MSFTLRSRANVPVEHSGNANANTPKGWTVMPDSLQNPWKHSGKGFAQVQLSQLDGTVK